MSGWTLLLTLVPKPTSASINLLSAIHHTGDWLNVVPSSALGPHPQDREFYFCLLCWFGLQMFGGILGALHVKLMLTLMGTIKWDAEVTVTESSDIIPFGMQFFQQPSQLP